MLLPSGTITLLDLGSISSKCTIIFMCQWFITSPRRNFGVNNAERYSYRLWLIKMIYRIVKSMCLSVWRLVRQRGSGNLLKLLYIWTQTFIYDDISSFVPLNRKKGLIHFPVDVSFHRNCMHFDLRWLLVPWCWLSNAFSSVYVKCFSIVFSCDRRVIKRSKSKSDFLYFFPWVQRCWSLIGPLGWSVSLAGPVVSMLLLEAIPRS